MKFKDLILSYRAENDLTQLELSKILGFSRTTIICWEKGIEPTKVNEFKVRKKLEKGRAKSYE